LCATCAQPEPALQSGYRDVMRQRLSACLVRVSSLFDLEKRLNTGSTAREVRFMGVFSRKCLEMPARQAGPLCGLDRSARVCFNYEKYLALINQTIAINEALSICYLCFFILKINKFPIKI
jgi:hypothetical protein